ncbi:MAG: putative CRISPR-associated protein [Stigonema ocellatum SAG 48.90 = DSM 106950]|nr:putative CRISPR-associated protein [Stigonema ocellatum SAG 48.90 = DSM 106950]
MRRVIISTIGTSLLTNQINRSSPDEKDWYNQLRDTANLTFKETPKEVQVIIETLKNRATQKLAQISVAQIRSASAELNGVYGLYREELEQGRQDMHWLIATDTAQGRESAKIVEEFLRLKGLNAESYTPKGLSTATTRSFADGIDDLLIQLDKWTEGSENVCFNLVGGFKSLQAYLNTIGMFYANEIIYIFEGAKSEVITIPRLPIKIDESAIEPYKLQLALMAAGSEVNRYEIVGIQEALIFAAEDEVTLSNWGRLIWDKSKNKILSGDLLPFARIKYQDSFMKDYKGTKVEAERVKLQETLAKIAYLLDKSSGDRSALRGDGGVQLETYKNTNIDHFRVTLSLRVSCQILEGNNLLLRYYGTHEHVERSERV